MFSLEKWRELLECKQSDKIGPYKGDIELGIIDMKDVFELRRKNGTILEYVDSKISSSEVYDKISHFNCRRYDVIFLLDMSYYEHKFYKLNLHSSTKYIIDLFRDDTGIHRCLALESKCYILLDLGDNNFYYTKYIFSNLIEVNKISKEWFIRIVSGKKVNLDRVDKLYKLVDKSNKNKDDIDFCLSIMEKNIDGLEVGPGDNGFIVLGLILAKLSYRDRYIMNLWIGWTFKKDPKYYKLIEKSITIAPNLLNPPNVYRETLVDKYNSEDNDYTLDFFKSKYL